MLAIAASTLATWIDVGPGWADEKGGAMLLAQRGSARRGGGGGGTAPGNLTIGRVLTQGAVQATEPATGRVAINPFSGCSLGVCNISGSWVNASLLSAPEPGSLALLASAFGLWGLTGRRKVCMQRNRLNAT